MQTDLVSRIALRLPRPVVSLMVLLLVVMLIFALTAAIVPGIPLGGEGGALTGFVP